MENTIAIQYTDESYLSRAELQSVLKTSLVEDFWKEILSYRKKNQVFLGLKTISGKPFYYVGTKAINEKIDDCKRNLLTLSGSFKKADSAQSEKAIKKSLLLSSLQGINKAYGSKSSELTLKAMLNGTYRENYEGKDKEVLNYLRTIEALLSKEISIPNENFLAYAYGELTEERDNLTKWFRLGNFDNSISKNFIYDTSGVFSYCPSEKIEGMMDEFYSFYKNSNVPSLVKALTSMYFMVYVRPFDSKNEEMATLLALDTLGYEDNFGKECFYLPLSQVLIYEPTLQDNYFVGVQKSGDLTYYILRSIDKLNSLFLTLKKELDDIILQDYAEEHYSFSKLEEEAIAKKEETEEKIAEIEGSAEEAPEAIIERVSEEKPFAKEKERIEKAVLSEPKALSSSKIETISKEEMLKANNDGMVALKKKESPLSDKEIKEYIRYLLESDYSLNKSQASFLANHCIVGHYYSIQQYKKFARCAYETARTSMEKLVEGGYYKKLQVKNKFVYTPLKQENK